MRLAEWSRKIPRHGVLAPAKVLTSWTCPVSVSVTAAASSESVSADLDMTCEATPEDCICLLYTSDAADE